MYGGSSSAGGRWSLGAKTYRAPTEGERIRERNDRLVREAERRKVEEIKHEARHVRKTQELQRQVERANARAIGMELGSRSPGMLGVTPIGLGRSPRLRSSSFSGVRSPGLMGLGSPAVGGLGMGGMGLASPRIGGMGVGMGGLGMGGLAAAGMHDARRREAELARVRAQRQRLEVEAARRERTASAMRRERAELALANERILASPRLSPALHPVGVGGLGVGGLGVPGAGLRRARSWSGGLGGMGGMGGLHGHHHHASPQIVPVPYPVHTPRMSPRILPVGVPAMPRSPRLSGGLGMRPPSPHIVNYNTYNVSPRMGAVGGLGGLGTLDDLAHHGHHHMGGVSPVIDPLVLDGGAPAGAMGMPGAFGGGVGVGGMGVGMGAHGFVVTDNDFEPGRQIVRELGYVQGVGGGMGMMDEEQQLSMAIANLTSNAQAMGANAVLSVETGEDVGGQIVVRGRAVVLS
ncbi:hypothetical protein JCM6882_003071 [Rhodosporidiobolus microsporus]